MAAFNTPVVFTIVVVLPGPVVAGAAVEIYMATVVCASELTKS